jgi:hypothetical protein
MFQRICGVSQMPGFLTDEEDFDLTRPFAFDFPVTSDRTEKGYGTDKPLRH